MDLKHRKVLVTGGCGFIGSHTTDALIEHGAEVIVVDNLLSGRRENLNPKAIFYEVNIGSDEFSAIVTKEEPEVVYHFVHYVFVPKSVENPLLDMDSISGTIRLLQGAKKVGVKKVVTASSGFVYGNNPNRPVNEEAPIDPVTPYVISKQAVESYLKFYQKAFNIPWVVLRYAAVYGPRQVTGAMADYIRKLAAGQQAEMWGDGNKTRDYVFIEDIVRANLLALTVPDDHPNPVYNIGAGKETTLNTLYWKIADILDKKPAPIYYPDRPGEQMRYCLDYEKIKSELGWEPRVTLDEGLTRTIDYARSVNFAK